MAIRKLAEFHARLGQQLTDRPAGSLIELVPEPRRQLVTPGYEGKAAIRLQGRRVPRFTIGPGAPTFGAGWLRARPTLAECRPGVTLQVDSRRLPPPGSDEIGPGGS